MNPNITEFETGVFTGKYITGVHDEYIKHLEEVRGVNARMKKEEAAYRVNGINHMRQESDFEINAQDDISLYNRAQ